MTSKKLTNAELRNPENVQMRLELVKSCLSVNKFTELTVNQQNYVLENLQHFILFGVGNNE